jgi:hypothetical protein
MLQSPLTNSTDYGLSFEAGLPVTQLVKKFPAFYGTLRAMAHGAVVPTRPQPCDKTQDAARRLGRHVRNFFPTTRITNKPIYYPYKIFFGFLIIIQLAKKSSVTEPEHSSLSPQKSHPGTTESISYNHNLHF